eukprot:CAMPEP_0119316028 /NCGR_PEP_ID=MMETSP1333-20130426/38171_1 /TAXON_ID=418940 /ORGANISM="Scyphosphaera apsteinii, Strain RCC1455" /LENGTH=192 /DNA_ID=CAMNT_0007321559 /DNA_START=216 /DNA_END=794 /DNA_ORIENTATION=+
MGAPFGFTACWTRKAVLDKYYNGVDDYRCCQGYIPTCCCIDTSECCIGSPLGLCCEGFCCPIFSISIARLHLMDSKRIRPDPCDYKLIACSNCLQCLSCILDIVAIFVDAVKDLAEIVDLIADLFTCSVAGCMGAQIHHEIKKDKDGVVFVVVEGVPVVTPNNVSLAAQDGAVPVVQAVPVGAPPKGAEMER